MPEMILNMEIAQNPTWQPGAGFWRTGLVLVLIAFAVLVGEVAQYIVAIDAVTNAAATQVRSEHPSAALAFKQWDDCRHGRGRYADGQKPVFYTHDQCIAAAIAQAEPGAQAQVSAALKSQDAAVAAADATVIRAWPLSLFL